MLLGVTSEEPLTWDTLAHAPTCLVCMLSSNQSKHMKAFCVAVPCPYGK